MFKALHVKGFFMRFRLPAGLASRWLQLLIVRHIQVQPLPRYQGLRVKLCDENARLNILLKIQTLQMISYIPPE